MIHALAVFIGYAVLSILAFVGGAVLVGLALIFADYLKAYCRARAVL